MVPLERGWRSARLCLVFLISAQLHFQTVCAIQCYSCKASGSNELEANIRCLEKAYLEECEEFYHYYNDVENGDIHEYNNYYYYDDQSPVSDPGPGSNSGPDGQVGRARQPPYANNVDATQPDGRESVTSSSGRSSKSRGNVKEERSKRASKDKDSRDVDYAQYYEYFALNDTSTGSKAAANNRASAKDEHYCYSMTGKGSWESYTVEKGCKKIIYCKASVANKPDWMHPWNFCCDRSRCNVKLVKDTPQRVYGMACRRDDDCIQGHNSRPVCPSFFKSCPRAYSGLVKMECKSASQTMASVKTGTKYRHLYRDKKCYCTKGYYPKGPICTSASAGLRARLWMFTASVMIGLIRSTLQH